MVLKQRINWIDWAKVFAIYLVVLGHLLSKTGREGYIFNFIYSLYILFTCHFSFLSQVTSSILKKITFDLF